MNDQRTTDQTLMYTKMCQQFKQHIEENNQSSLIKMLAGGFPQKLYYDSQTYSFSSTYDNNFEAIEGLKTDIETTIYNLPRYPHCQAIISLLAKHLMREEELGFFKKVFFAYSDKPDEALHYLIKSYDSPLLTDSCMRGLMYNKSDEVFDHLLCHHRQQQELYFWPLASELRLFNDESAYHINFNSYKKYLELSFEENLKSQVFKYKQSRTGPQDSKEQATYHLLHSIGINAIRAFNNNRHFPVSQQITSLICEKYHHHFQIIEPAFIEVSMNFHNIQRFQRHYQDLVARHMMTPSNGVSAKEKNDHKELMMSIERVLNMFPAHTCVERFKQIGINEQNHPEIWRYVQLQNQLDNSPPCARGIKKL